ncbi:DoxX family protein [Flavobacterium terrigena]|uniref:Putative oxidoreductase n=1 Tax=Flavobacterium terrigena TaxID=402734 RepID=A0A1H6QYZ4_9FLAO|nr:putative oxidoreductase [Flavobacterium terrigena]
MKNNDLGLLIFRLSLGLLMLLHGIAKLTHGVDFLGDMFKNLGLPSFLAYSVYIGEVIAPVLIVIGYRTKLAAIVFAFTMVVAVGMAHSADIFSLSETGGWALELQGLYFFGALALFFTGAGKYAASTNSKWD